MRYIGIDLHTNNFTAVCLNKQQDEIFCKKYNYNDAAFKEFKKILKRSDRIAVEATANSADFIDKIGKSVKHVGAIAPSKFHVISKSTNKTDKNDARALALFLAQDMLPKARTKEEISRRILSMVDTRNLMVTSRTRFINKVHAVLVQHGYKVSKTQINERNIEKTIASYKLPQLAIIELDILKEQIYNLNNNIKLIEEKIFEQSVFFKHYKTIVSVQGFGKLSATIMSAIIENVDNFPSAGHLCSYFGIVPKVRISNDTAKKTGITKQGTKLGRTTLVQSTWVAIRYNDYLKSYYERLKAKKCPQKAIIATSRKLLIILYHAMNKDIIYTNFNANEYYHQTKE